MGFSSFCWEVSGFWTDIVLKEGKGGCPCHHPQAWGRLAGCNHDVRGLLVSLVRSDCRLPTLTAQHFYPLWGPERAQVSAAVSWEGREGQHLWEKSLSGHVLAAAGQGQCGVGSGNPANWLGSARALETQCFFLMRPKAGENLLAPSLVSV